jgi:Flp pilus assembly protein TadG
MMTFLANARRFVDSTRAVAAVEFAMILPVLLLMFLGSFDAGNAIAVYAKVRAASYSLAAITNQYGSTSADSISTTTMTAITGAVTQMMAPYSSSPATVVISQIQAASATKAYVSWSYSPTAGAALTQGAAFTSLPSNFATNTCNSTYPCYAIFAKVSYTFTPMFGAFLTGPITLSDSIYTTPRISTCVQYNSIPSNCATLL